MGREIDERIVQMRFENGQFERGVQTSIKSVQALKKGLNFEDSIKGFEQLDKASKGLKLDAIASSVETLTSKFSWFHRTVMRQMDQLTDKAINTGKALVKSLSTDQISAGWTKFENKTGAVQTIMAATAKQFTDTGEQMEFVNAQLDKLNWFTDETSYNFVDMVSNIGKFTSNNIALDESVTAMQGIANWAAISGANAGEASRAMYNLSQAISSGSLRLQDWISIENANMGTAAFKEMAIQSALTAGTLKKSGDKIVTSLKGTEVTVENFRETLQEKWLDTNTLMTTLDQYGRATNALNSLYEATGVLTSTLVSDIDKYTAGTKSAAQISEEWGTELSVTEKILEDFQSETMQFGLKAFKAAQEAKTFTDAIESVKDAVSTGWMKSFELIFGNYLQAKEFWTDIANTLYDIFAESGNARNEMLAAWNEGNGRVLLIDTIYGMLGLIVKMMGAIKEGWQTIFPPMTAQRLLDITEMFHNFVTSLLASEETLNKISRTVAGFAAVLDILKTIGFGALNTAIKLVRALLGEASFDILGFTANIGDSIVAFRNWVKEETFLTDAMNQLIDVIVRVRDSVQFFIQSFLELPVIQTIITRVESVVGNFFIEFSDLIKNGGKDVIDFTKIFEMFSKLPKIGSFSELIDWFASIGEAIKKWFNDIIEKYFPVTKLRFEGLIQFISKTVSQLEGPIGFFVNIFTTVGNTLKNFIGQIDAIDIMLFATAASIIMALKQISNAISSIGDIFGFFGDLVSGLQKTLDKYAQSKATKNYAMSLLILAAALFVLSKVDSDKLMDSATVLGYLAIGILAFNAAMSKISSSDFKPEKFTLLSAAIVGLAAALLLIDKTQHLGISLITLAGLTIGLAAVAVIVSKVAPQMNFGAKSILGFSVSIIVLVTALKKIGKLDTDTLKNGTTGLIAIILGLAAAIRLMNGGIKVSGSNNTVLNAVTGGAILAFVVSLHIVLAAIKSLNKMDPKDFISGLIGVGAIFLEIGLLLKLIQTVNGPALKGAGATVLSIAIAMNIIIPAIKALSKIDKEMMTVAMANLALIGLVFVGAIAATNLAGKYSVRAGLMLIEMAAALAIMPIIVRALGRMNTKEVIQGTAVIVAIGLMFAQVVKQSKTVRKSTASLVAMTAAIAVLSIAVYQLAKLDPISVLASAGALSVLLLSLAQLFKILGSNQLNVGGIIKLIPSMVIMVELVVVLSIIAMELSKIENPLGAAEAAIGVSAMLSALSVAMLALNKAPDVKLGTIGNLYILSGVIVVLGYMLSHISKLPGLTGGHAVAMIGSISLLLTAIVGCYTAIGALGKFNITPDKKMTIQFAIFAAIVSAVGGVMAILSRYTNVDKVIPISKTLALFMTEMAALFTIFSLLMSKMNLNKDATIQFAIFSALLIPIGAVIGVMSNYVDPIKAIASSASLALLLPSMAVSMGILSKMNVKLDVGQAGQFLIFSVIAAALGAALVGLAALANYFSVGVPTLLGVTAVISILVPVLGTTVTLMAKFAGTANPSTIGAIASLAAGMAIVFSVVTALIVGLGYLVNEFEFIGDALETAPKYTMLLGEAIGGLVGGLVGGLISGLAGGVLEIIPILGQKLSEFGTNMQPFFDMLSDLDDGMIAKAGTFAGVVLALTGAEFVSALGTLASGVLTAVSSFFGFESTDKVESFRAFGQAVVAFAGELGDINASQVKDAADAAAALAGLESSLPRIRGVISMILGEKDLGAFGIRLAAFGAGLKLFSNSIEGIDTEALTAVVPASEALIALEKGVPRKGGMLQEFLGEQDIGLFGSRLVQFGLYLKLYSVTVDGLNTDAVQASADAAKILINLENGVPRDGGILQSFLGSKGFDKFGERLWTLGVGLNNYVIQTKKIQASDVEGSAAAIKILSELEHGIQTTGGVGSFLFGDNSFAKFGENLKKFGKALVDYATTVSVIDTTKLNQVTAVVSKLLYFAPEDETLSKNFQAFGKNAVTWILLGFQSGVREKTAGIRKEITSLMEVIKQTVVLQLNISGSKSLVMQNNGKYVVEGLIAGMKNSDAVARMEKTAAGLANKINESFRTTADIASPSIVMKENGVWLVKGVAEGITSDTSAEEAAKKKAENIISAFQTEFDRLAAIVTKNSLSYQLWEANEGRLATEDVKVDKQLQRNIEEMQELKTEYEYRANLVAALAQKFGTDSKEYRDAEHEMNQTLLSLMQKRNEVEDYITEYVSQRSDEISGLFDKEISDIGTAMERAEVLYQTWEATDGRTATDIEKQQKKLEYMALSLQSEADTIKMYRAQMLRIEKEFGADSEAYKTARTNYEKAVLSMYNQRNEIEDYEKEILEKQKEWESNKLDRGKAYSEFVTNKVNLQTKEMLEMTDEEFREWAKQVTGYGIEWPVPEMPDLDYIVQSAFNEEGAKYLSETVQSATEKGFLEGLESIATQKNGAWVQPLIDYFSQIDDILTDTLTGTEAPIFEFDETITEETKKKTEKAATTAKKSGKTVGKAASDGVKEGLGDSKSEGFSWYDDLMAGVTNASEKGKETIKKIGSKTGYNYLFGLDESTDTNSPSKEMYKRGEWLIEGLTNGVEENLNPVYNAGNTSGKAVLNGVEQALPQFYAIGGQTIQRLVKGIRDKAPAAIEAAREVANSVSNIMSVALQVKSPSRVTAEIGKYVSLGMAKGITDNTGSVEYASEELANKTIDMLDYAKTAIMNVLETDDDFSPQITPVLNMDELKRQARDIPSILDRQNGISTRLANLSAQSIVRNRDAATSEKSKQMEEKVTNIEFTQNNYSPKALNRRDIYRQTRNQISQLKGATKIR